jgi:glucosamine--fructose-6-phosphate aminotransferase (isomerizing)
MEDRQHTFDEINSQPAVWAETTAAIAAQAPEIGRAWRALQPKRALFIGCGSTHYLSLVAAALLQSATGIPARGVPASELLLFPELSLSDPAQTLLVAISRSGTTTETLLAVERFRQAGGLAVWAITCYPQSDLAEMADLVLVAEAAQETSVVQTRSFSNMLLLAQGMAAAAGGEDVRLLQRLPEMGRALLDRSLEPMEALGRRDNLERFFFLGSGLQYGVANEGMLKIKEMSLSHSETYHFLEFRHGPKSLVGKESLVVGLLSQEAYASERQVLEEMVQLGGAVLEITPREPMAPPVLSAPLPLVSPAWVRLPLYLIPLQLLAYYRTVSRQLDPDNPRNLGAVVYLDPRQFAAESGQRAGSR